MGDLCKLIWWLFADLFRSRAAMEAEILVLRHQLNVLRRKSPRRVVFSGFERMVFAGLYALAPSILVALQIVKPNTVIRWQRAGFRAYWRWKSRSRGGRPKTAAEISQLIRKMSIANPLWGAPRIHGELLKLGIKVGQTTVAKYMAKWRRPPSQGWKTFLYNHADGIASMDLFVVPTISFRLLYGLLNSTPAGSCSGLGSLPIRLPNGSLGNSQRRTAGEMHRAIWCGIETVSTAAGSSGAFAPWAFVIGRSLPVRPGKTDTQSGSSARSDVSTSTTSSFLANAIWPIC